MVNILFSAYFGGHLCYHSNGKSQRNLRLLHFEYCSNKLIFLYFSLIGGPKKHINARSFLCYHSNGKSQRNLRLGFIE